LCVPCSHSEPVGGMKETLPLSGMERRLLGCPARSLAITIDSNPGCLYCSLRKEKGAHVAHY